ncbi:MAG: hypothetical protein IOC39_15060 [Burkholderia sp.]|jgi:hypothetical protein|uniref:hypothetical protein n=1 Tax=Burkholderia TaxID=32008 RepID=UPI001CA43772|nr:MULTISPECIES: hypothetical protein [Burkholderia]MCA3642020.1 hypothetical protein [Methylobacterium sp.]MBY8605985.1 hypothetical protein [Burkholderia arboris]MCA3779126.1 hypothetical protein [Burkholderia sp.]MCA3797154.1 hypothetical protein [Burkholderia sp.]MCA3812096.1 hypothetical protein [Burkholderia sp.]
MKQLWMMFVLIELGILVSGCGDVPPKPVLPDGAHRVSVNQQTPVPPGSSAPLDGACP